MNSQNAFQSPPDSDAAGYSAYRIAASDGEESMKLALIGASSNVGQRFRLSCSIASMTSQASCVTLKSYRTAKNLPQSVATSMTKPGLLNFSADT